MFSKKDGQYERGKGRRVKIPSCGKRNGNKQEIKGQNSGPVVTQMMDKFRGGVDAPRRVTAT